MYQLDIAATIMILVAIAIAASLTRYEQNTKPKTHDPIHGDILTSAVFASFCLMILAAIFGFASTTLVGFCLLITTIISCIYFWDKRYGK